jgi:catechol 2,3-dioxygenase-like lactoylglutathione lyase family enzyme
MSFLRAIPALPVREIGRSVTFYRDVLGFTPGYTEDGFAILRRDAVELHLWAAADESWQARRSATPVQSGAESFLAGTGSCRIEVEGVDELYRRIQPLGVLHARGEIADRPYGMREFAVVDPDNNLITFFAEI